MDSKDLLKRVKEDGIKFISLQFSDVIGAVKSEYNFDISEPDLARVLRGRLCCRALGWWRGGCHGRLLRWLCR